MEVLLPHLSIEEVSNIHFWLNETILLYYSTRNCYIR